MAQDLEIRLNVQSDEARKELDKLETSLKGVAKESEKTSKGFDDVASNGGAIAILDQLTGGLASQVKNAYESTRLFNFSLKGTKKALIATGLGVFIVALGTIIAYWDDITELIEGTNRRLQAQNEIVKQNITTSNTQLEILELQQQIINSKGESEKNIVKDIRKQLLLQQEQYKQLVQNLQIQIETEKSKNREVSFWEGIKITAARTIGFGLEGLAIADAINANSEKSVELQKELDDAKKNSLATDLKLAQLDANEEKKKTDSFNKAQNRRQKQNEQDAKDAKDKADNLEKIRLAEIDTEAERRAEELRAVEQQYADLKALALKYGEDTTELENARLTKVKEVKDKFDAEDKAKVLAEQEAKIAKLQLDKENDVLSFEEQRELLLQRENELNNDRLLSDEQRTKLEKQYSDARIAIGNAETEAKKKNIDNLGNVLGQASAIAGENTKVGKGLAVASATINTYRGVSDALAAVTVTPFETALKFANAAAIGVSGIMNVKKILSVKVPNVGGGGGGSAPSISLPSGGVSAPQFNIAGGNTANQLADSLESNPTRAYVVSNDVTTAQSLDRNIISNASIGG